VADFILDMDMCVEAAESEIDRVTARKKRFDGAARRMREYVLRVMEMRDQDKIVCNTCELVRRLNPESVEITQPHLIPDDMKRVPPPPALVPDKAKIKEAIKSGHHVEGARLTRTARLVIQ
jgi:hypothetical protein